MLKIYLTHIPFNCKTIQFIDDVVILCADRSMDRIVFSLYRWF